MSRRAKFLFLWSGPLAVVASFVLWLGLAACTSTIAPKSVESRAASYDGNAQNSGFLGNDRITASARARFNDLARVYGRDAGVVADQGLSPNSDGSWSITKESLVKFLEMSDWRRAGLQPLKP